LYNSTKRGLSANAFGVEHYNPASQYFDVNKLKAERRAVNSNYKLEKRRPKSVPNARIKRPATRDTMFDEIIKEEKDKPAPWAYDAKKSEFFSKKLSNQDNISEAIQKLYYEWKGVKEKDRLIIHNPEEKTKVSSNRPFTSVFYIYK